MQHFQKTLLCQGLYGKTTVLNLSTGHILCKRKLTDFLNDYLSSVQME